MFTQILLTLFAGLCISATNAVMLRKETAPFTNRSTSPTTLPRNLTNETDSSESANSPTSRLEPRVKGVGCWPISTFCVNQWNCLRAWQLYEDDWWLCQYTSRSFRHCDARIGCAGWDLGDNTCIRGSLVKQLLLDINKVEKCGAWRCGYHMAPPEQVGGLQDCKAEFEYCIDCKDRNKDPPWADLPDQVTRRAVNGNASVSES